MSKRLLGRCLLIVAIMCGVASVPAVAILGYAGYYMLVPRYSAVVDFDKLGFNLRLDFYLTNDEASDSGRYLSVISGGSYHTMMIAGWDWSHRARTSIYRIDANHIALSSALGHDYTITLTPFATAPVISDPGDQWQYLGAFDFVFPSGGQPRLQFYNSRLAECIPMGSSDPATWAEKPRARARQASCPAATQ